MSMLPKNFQKRSESRRELSMEIESLEARQMLAGNVLVEINGAGDLIVTGDSEGNVVALSIDADGYVEVLNGDDTDPRGPTTITAIGLESSRVSGDIIINMKGGDDGVAIVPEGATPENNTVNVPVRNINVRMGAGNDYCFIGASLLFDGFGLGVEGDVKMNGGAGDDQLLMKYSDARGDVTITGGGGDDIGGMVTSQTTDFTATGGAGNDRIGLAKSVVEGDVKLNAGGGDNYVGAYDSSALQLSIRTGSGSDEVLLNGFTSKYDVDTDVEGDVSVSTGGGDDQITILEAGMGELSVATAGGNDVIRAEFSDATSLRLNAGGGDDSVRLRDSEFEFGSSQISMGSGDDALDMTRVSMSGVVSGNGGFDRFVQFFSSVDDIDLRSFESII